MCFRHLVNRGHQPLYRSRAERPVWFVRRLVLVPSHTGCVTPNGQRFAVQRRGQPVGPRVTALAAQAPRHSARALRRALGASDTETLTRTYNVTTLCQWMRFDLSGILGKHPQMSGSTGLPSPRPRPCSLTRMPSCSTIPVIRTTNRETFSSASASDSASLWCRTPSAIAIERFESSRHARRPRASESSTSKG